MTRGILEAHAAGVVTSASLIVNTPGFEGAVRAALSAPRLGVGLHLNLTAGRPVAPAREVASLLNPVTGRFHSLPSLALRAAAGSVVAAQVRAECAAQIARARQAGVPLTHLDSHRHVHALRGIWAPVAEAALEAGIGVVRVPVERPAAARVRLTPLLKATLLALSWRLAAAGRQVPRHADHFRGATLLGDPDFERRLVEVINGLGPGTTELVVHPGYAGGDLETLDSYTTPRERELKALLSPAVRERLARGDVRLVSFADL